MELLLAMLSTVSVQITVCVICYYKKEAEMQATEQ
jgi:hypothetical protein